MFKGSRAYLVKSGSHVLAYDRKIEIKRVRKQFRADVYLYNPVVNERPCKQRRSTPKLGNHVYEIVSDVVVKQQ